MISMSPQQIFGSNRIKRLFSGCFILFGIFLNYGQQKQVKTVFVIVDGISADVIEDRPTPNLDAVAKVGGYTRAYMGGEKGGYSQTPTISAVGYNSLLTGTWVNKHNVWDNDIKAPNYNYPTIFKLFREQLPKSRMAVFSTWEDNRTKLIGEGLPETDHLKMDLKFDGYELDTVLFPHDPESDYIRKIDQYVVTKAVETIGEEGPDISWVYLQYTDDMGHRHGDSAPYHKAVQLMDDQIGRIWNALQLRMQRHDEIWQLYITTDHGRDPDTGKHHGGQSDRERLTWIVTNTPGLNTYFKHNPGVVSILPTILRAHNISPSRDQLWELDGIPLIGKISVAEAHAVLEGENINLKWKAFDKKGAVKIWLSTTNNYASGGEDKYILVDRIKTKKEGVAIDVSKWPSNFYKIVIEGKNNSINTWVLKKSIVD